MSLAVQSYPELFTLVLGWQQYEAIWQLWVALGLPFVPLLGLIMKTLTHSLSSAAPLDGERLLRTLEVQFFSLLLVITLAAQPLVPLKTHQITYTPQCGSQ